MGLAVKGLHMDDFRNSESRSIELSRRTTVLVGPNASGKTNTVEALQMLTAGYSFRRPQPRQLVREGAAAARIEARLEGDGRVVDMRCDVAQGRRQFFRNGKKCHATDVPGTLLSVLFTPDDLALVKRGASVRREELDGFGRQAAAGYSRLLAAYTRAVEQRNRLLREERPDPGLLDAWDASVAVGGAALLHSRLRLFSRLAPKVAEAYAQISGGESLSCEYVCSLGNAAVELDRDSLAERFGAALAAARLDDLRRQQTTVGPHRDDVSFLIDGRDARAFASQGQQRSAVLALKMAETSIAEEVTGSRPLLLLDDVMSELDAARCDAVVGMLLADTQAVITTTNLGYFSDGVLCGAEVVSYG
ncbi:DNA replication/repair protein RecF [Paratractidigestivibacter sp.]|uniref:DNA replication/repair protein RecF n=1 Tax=Paratractidigestivibacter sp. TaxID=2847316 RepID=UPI002AC9CBD5|nr:DNA replication and repair protein RecF [Paratractidigestivibacter sp.]